MSEAHLTQENRPSDMMSARFVMFGLAFGLVLFGLAGRLDWWIGWLFLLVFLGFWLGLLLWLRARDPGLMNERADTYRQDVHPLEKLVVLLVTVLEFGVPGMAALDAGRYGWSTVPPAAQVIGWIGLGLAAWFVAWSLGTNSYASTVVRVQEERGHNVVAEGPYRYVRHPMYVGIIFFALACPLALGSWLALLPGLLMIVLVVVRTAHEDRLLRRDLAGYAEYARRTRHRLLPGLW